MNSWQKTSIDQAFVLVTKLCSQLNREMLRTVPPTLSQGLADSLKSLSNTRECQKQDAVAEDAPRSYPYPEAKLAYKPWKESCYEHFQGHELHMNSMGFFA